MKDLKQIVFQRTDAGRLIESENPAEVWPGWQGENESWLFMSPHDDDIVCGCGLTFLSALRTGIKTSAAVVTNGKMGYCRPEQKETIAAIRLDECRASFKMLGLPEKNLYFLHYDDGNLNRQAGRRFDDSGAAYAIAGASGLQNSFVWLLRRVRPTRLFLPSVTDLHPDHKFTNTEMMISIFHAQGNIWPELGEPIPEIPRLYEYPTYSNLLTPPSIRVCVPDELLELKLNSIYAYKSQEQIELTIEMQRRGGTKEYLREVRFDLFEPEKCAPLFEERQ
ncbi:MAG: PIG-L family deacetylase [Thermoguttaceae bacterium]|nr:PIG-L family deacetylase [Thermoguttaceae bacterium]